MLDELHSLEDWVAVKESPFESSEPKKTNLRFIINWDDHERHISITCHETRQRNVKRTLAKNSAKAASRMSSNSQSPEDLCSWSGLFTLQDISYAHQQLCLIRPDLENFPPNLPYEPRGIWSLLYSVEIPENFNQQLESYLSTALQICGNKLITDYLFSSDVVAEQYFENCSELRQKAYIDDVSRLVDRLKELFRRGDGLIKMVDMIDLYSQVDTALAELAAARAELFNIMLQPFLDMRELSFNKLLGLQDDLEDEFMSQERRDRCLMGYSEWQEHYVGAIEAINEVRVKYFAQCMETTKDVISQLEKDKQKFGKSTWELSGEGRMRDFSQALSQEMIQWLQARQEKYRHRIEKIKQEMALLEEGPNYITELESLEELAFDLQVKLYDTQLTVLQEHDKMHRVELAQIKEQLKEADEAVVFFDALDSLDYFEDDEDDDEDEAGMNRKSKKIFTDPRIVDIQSKLSKINRRRARIRSSKQSFVAQHRSRAKEKKSEEASFQSHHWIQMKRDQLKAEQEKRKDFIQYERKKAVDRLRNYKLSHPSPRILKPQQYKKSSKKDETRSKQEEDAIKEREKRDAALARDKARRAYQPPKLNQAKAKKATENDSPSALSQPLVVPPPPPAPPPPLHVPLLLHTTHP